MVFEDCLNPLKSGHRYYASLPASIKVTDVDPSLNPLKSGHRYYAGVDFKEYQKAYKFVSIPLNRVIGTIPGSDPVMIFNYESQSP